MRFDLDSSVVDIRLSVFRTSLGWFGLAGRADRVHRLWIGHASRQRVRQAADGLPEADWSVELRERLLAYTEGSGDDFRDVAIVDGHLPQFSRQVVRAARDILPGETVSYAELAARAGRPRAARAVGNVMARNRFPIIVPCHRVIGSDGELHGFSAPSGTSLKSRLLQLESPLAAASLG